MKHRGPRLTCGRVVPGSTGLGRESQPDDKRCFQGIGS